MTKKLVLPGPIGFLLIPHFTSIAFASAVESLRIANRYLDERYRWVLLSADGLPCPDGNGIPVAVQGSLRQMEGLGSLIVCADIEPERFTPKALLADLRRQASRRVRLGGIDTGAHVLAYAGLLDGYRATLHWENAPTFREHYPKVTLSNSLFEFDRDRFTCAGGTAVIDMMLYAIEAQWGREVAIRVSEHFVHERIRQGDERQRMEIPARFGVHHPKIVQAIKVMESQLEESLPTNQLADAVGVSARQLLRLFKTYLDTSPARLHLYLRLERARRLILQSDMSVIDVAIASGFQSHSHFSRVYREEFGRPPRAERKSAADRRLVIMDIPSPDHEPVPPGH